MDKTFLYHKMREDIREPKVLKKIGELHSSGVGPTGIRRALKKEFEIEVDTYTIKNVIDFNISRTKEILEGDEKMREMLKEDLEHGLQVYRKAMTTIERLQARVDTVLDKPKLSHRDIISVKAILSEILNYLYYNDRRIEKFLVTKEIKISTFKKTQMVIEGMEKLADQGYITIHEFPEQYKKMRKKKEVEE